MLAAGGRTQLDSADVGGWAGALDVIQWMLRLGEQSGAVESADGSVGCDEW
jgi:hypothetical protein